MLTFSLPMVFGTAVGLVLGWSVASALLLGSLLASHTLVVYPLVRKLGLGSDPAVATAVGATVMTDTLALVVLAFVAGGASGSGSPLEIGLRTGLALVILAGGSALVLPRVTGWAFTRFGTDRPVRYSVALHRSSRRRCWPGCSASRGSSAPSSPAWPSTGWSPTAAR